MALKIRLRQQGKTNRQTYRLVVMDIRTKRDGKYLENLGWYNPTLKESNAQINGERVNFWLGQGAQLSHDAKQIVGKYAADVLKQYEEKERAKKTKLTAKRRALRRAKHKGKAGAK